MTTHYTFSMDLGRQHREQLAAAMKASGRDRTPETPDATPTAAPRSRAPRWTRAILADRVA